MNFFNRRNVETVHSLREALGPGFNLHGPSERLLKSVSDGANAALRRNLED